MAESNTPLDVTQLVSEHHGTAFRYAYRLTGTLADAEDLTQQAFLAAQQAGRQLQAVGNPRAWLLTVVRNAFLKGRRRPAAGQLTAEQLDDLADDVPPPGEGIDRERLQAALAELPDDYRVVVLMFYFEERSYRQIAAELDVPIGTVMSRLSRAKGHLRKRLGAAEAVERRDSPLPPAVGPPHREPDAPRRPAPSAARR